MRRPESSVPGPGPARSPSHLPSAARNDAVLRVVIRELMESMECLVADPSRWDEESARRHLHHVRSILEGSRRPPPSLAGPEGPVVERPGTPWGWLRVPRDDESVTRDLQRSFL